MTSSQTNITPLPEDFTDLVLAHCDERLTPEEAARLSTLLRDHPEAQRHFLRLASIHARLSWEYGPRELAPLAMPAERPLEEIPNSSESRPGRWLAVAALAASLACFAAFLQFTANWRGIAQIARLSGGVDAIWEGAAHKIGQALTDGNLRLRSGVAEITFDSGVVLVLEGPADLDLTSDRCFLRRGQLVARVPPQAVGFVVETARLKVLDLGTEFGVSAESEQGESVQVYQGEVIATVKQPKDAASGKSPEERLESGQALSVSLAGNANTTPFIPDRFVRYLPAPNDPSGRGKYPSNDARLEEVHLYPAPAKVVVDGDLAEWDRRGEFQSACIPPYDAHYAVAGMMMYDAQTLYIAARVKDPFPLRGQISPHVPRDLYGHGGCVALRLSTDRKMGWPLRGDHAEMRKGRPAEPSDVSDHLAFVVLWFYEPEQLACLHLRYGMDYHGTQVNPPGYRGVFKKTAEGDGYTVEYAIPWSLLGAAQDPPQAGDVLGCTWLVHWSDAEGRNWRGQLIDITKPDEPGWNFQRAATWGRAVYEPKK